MGALNAGRVKKSDFRPLSCFILFISGLAHTNDKFCGWLSTMYCRPGNKRVAKRLWACVEARKLNFEHLLQLLTLHTMTCPDRNTVHSAAYINCGMTRT